MSEDNEHQGAKKRRWWPWLRGALIALLLTALALAAALYVSSDGLRSFGASAEGERLARIQASPRYQGGRFVNDLETGTVNPNDIWPMLKEQFTGTQRRTPQGPIPVRNPRAAYEAPPESGLRVTWMGHSTMFIEIDGARILTDPVWGERASPSRWVGPKRFHAPPIELEALAPLDAVVISHDHYDHLDMSTIQRLVAMDVPRVYAPQGVGAHLEFWGMPAQRITEFFWWDERTLPGHDVRVVATPSRHFSGRSVGNNNQTLWASWSFIGPTHRVYFSGDTGFSDHFTEIGDKLGPFDVTMLEVGAWNKHWEDVHLGPHGALDAHNMLKGDRLIPVHWGTFGLAPHGWRQPARYLAREAAGRGVSLVAPRVGQPVEPTTASHFEAWWDEVGPPGEGDDH